MVADLLLAAGAVFFAIHTKPLAAEEALLLANVEAIAQGENHSRELDCYRSLESEDHLPEEYVYVVYCGSCTTLPAKNFTGLAQCSF